MDEQNTMKIARRIKVNTGGKRVNKSVTWGCPVCDYGHRYNIHQESMKQLVNIVHRINLWYVHFKAKCTRCEYQHTWNLSVYRYNKWKKHYDGRR